MWQYTPFTPALIVTAGACALLSLFVWRRRPAPGAQLAATAFLTTAAWNAGYALELSSVRLDDQQLWADVQYLFISAVPGLWLAFTLTYTGREQRLTRTVVGGLFVEPVITIALAWGSDVVPWLRAGAEQIVADGFVIVSWQYGPYF